jgi:hypothetical protein
MSSGSPQLGHAASPWTQSWREITGRSILVVVLLVATALLTNVVARAMRVCEIRDFARETTEASAGIEPAMRVLQTHRLFSCLRVEKPSKSEEIACLG